MSKKCRPLFKKHESNKSLSLVILRTIDERNRKRPPQSRQFIAQAARLSSRAAFVWRAEQLPVARHATGRPAIASISRALPRAPAAEEL